MLFVRVMPRAFAVCRADITKFLSQSHLASDSHSHREASSAEGGRTSQLATHRRGREGNFLDALSLAGASPRFTARDDRR